MILAIAIMLIGFVGLFYYKKSRNVRSIMNEVIPIPFGTLKEMILNGTADTNIKSIAEIEGIISDKKNIIAPLSGAKCVFYTHTVREKYKEKYYTYINNRKRVAWATKYRTLKEDSRGIVFEVVSDDGEQVFVNPIPSEIFLTDSHNEFIPIKKSVGYDIKILGEERKEKSLLVGTRIYVVGELNMQNNELVISKSDNPKLPMIIANKSKEQYYRQHGIMKWFFLILSIINISLGITLLIIEALKG